MKLLTYDAFSRLNIVFQDCHLRSMTRWFMAFQRRVDSIFDPVAARVGTERSDSLNKFSYERFADNVCDDFLVCGQIMNTLEADLAEAEKQRRHLAQKLDETTREINLLRHRLSLALTESEKESTDVLGKLHEGEVRYAQLVAKRQQEISNLEHKLCDYQIRLSIVRDGAAKEQKLLHEEISRLTVLLDTKCDEVKQGELNIQEHHRYFTEELLSLKTNHELEMQELSRQHQELREENRKWTEEKASLEERLNVAMKDVRALSESEKAISQLLKTTFSERDRYKLECTKNTSELSKLRSEIVGIDKEMQLLDSELLDEQQKVHTVMAENSSLLGTVDSQRLQLSRLGCIIEQVEAEKSQLEAEVAQQKKHLDEMKTREGVWNGVLSQLKRDLALSESERLSIQREFDIIRLSKPLGRENQYKTTADITIPRSPLKEQNISM